MICSSKRRSRHADLDTQLTQLKHCDMESRSITKMPYKEKNSLLVMMFYLQTRPCISQTVNDVAYFGYRTGTDFRGASF